MLHFFEIIARLCAFIFQVPCHWVDTEGKLQELAEKLEASTEFAVDLEHHSYRSYLGFTCLMQVSTRTEDFLIDALELRHAMPLLATAFSDPKIVKVLHGADMDILWLQRDFGLYVVNLFDTGQATRCLFHAISSSAYAFTVPLHCATILCSHSSHSPSSFARFTSLLATSL